MTHPPRPSWQGPRPFWYPPPPRSGASRPAPPLLLLECVDGLVDPLASLLEWSLPAQLVQSLVELLAHLLGRPFLAPHQDTTPPQPEGDHGHLCVPGLWSAQKLTADLRAPGTRRSRSSSVRRYDAGMDAGLAAGIALSSLAPNTLRSLRSMWRPPRSRPS